ncbi:MAG: hypothetical protein IT373_01695 [Polyangiaceae bacterium]|nr:hypothetical protein [Polyangiaceae bacterium]
MTKRATVGMPRYQARSERFMGGSMVAAFSSLLVLFVGLQWVAVGVSVASSLTAVVAGIVRRVRAPEGYRPAVENVTILFGLTFLVGVVPFLLLVALGVLGVRREIELP